MLKKFILKGQSGTSLFASSILQKSNSQLLKPTLGFQNIKPIDVSNIKLPESSVIDKNYVNKAKANQWWKDTKSNTTEFLGSDLGKQTTDTIMSAASSIPDMLGKKSQDVISTGVNAIAPGLNALVPGLGYGVQALDILDRSLGSSVKGFSGNTGVSGYKDYSVEGKDFRLSQFGSKSQLQNTLSKNKNLFLSAKTNADALLKKQQAGVQSIQNTGMTNKSKLSGGLDFSVLTAKKGASLDDIRNYIKTRNIEKEVPQNPKLEEKVENQEIIEVQKFQNGGNVIPSGALHKEKHNLENVNPELNGEITKKGIPVISYANPGDVLEYEEDGKTPKVFAKGGEIIQHAEIEKEEVILNLSLTKKLIELMKKDTPEAMIEAGRILSIELMENVTDNSGITEKLIDNEN